MPAEPYLAEIYMGGMNFAPRGYLLCHGQILSIAQNTALFSLLGTTFGGNGQTTFALPDLRGRVPIGFGQGPGLSSYSLGQVGGVERVTLLTSEMPAHNHSLNATSAAGNASVPTGAILANTGVLDKEYNNSSGVPINSMSLLSIGTRGEGQPHTNIQPYLVLTFYIASEGIFPARN